MGEATGTAAEAAGAALVLPRPIARVVLPPNRGLRVHSMSDLHTDYTANAAWCVRVVVLYQLLYCCVFVCYSMLGLLCLRGALLVHVQHTYSNPDG